MLVGEQIVEVFECRAEFSVEQEKDRLGEDVGDEDEKGAHEVGHREALSLHQLQFGLKQIFVKHENCFTISVSNKDLWRGSIKILAQELKKQPFHQFFRFKYII